MTLKAFSQNALRDDLNGIFYDPNLFLKEYETEDGSPYLDIDFKPAKIGGREKTYLIRFNGYKGNVEVWIKENQVIVLDPSTEEKITLLDGSEKAYVVRKYKNPNGEIIQGFLEIIQSSDSYTLYKKEIVKYFKKTEAKAYAPAKPARFEKASAQFYLKPPKEEIPVHLPNSKKRFLAVFGPKTSSQAKAMIKKERLDLNNEEDIVQILNAIY